MRTEEMLRQIIDLHGRSVIFNKQKINAIVADLTYNDKQNRFLIELSIRAEIPTQVANILEGSYYEDYYTDELIYCLKDNNYSTRFKALKIQFKNDFPLEMTSIDKIVDAWIYAIEPEPINVYCYDFVGFYRYKNWLGKYITTKMYDHASGFSEGLAIVGVSTNVSEHEIEVLGEINVEGIKYGYINRSGKEVIPMIYDHADSFSGGFALVKLNGKCGYIDREGKWIKDEN